MMITCNSESFTLFFVPGTRARFLEQIPLIGRDGRLHGPLIGYRSRVPRSYNCNLDRGPSLF